MSKSHHNPARSWPFPVDQADIQREALALFEAFRAGAAEARAEVLRSDPAANPASYTLKDARNALARSYGFPGWAQVERYFDTVEKHTRNPDVELEAAETGNAPGLTDAFLRLACLTQGAQDHPSRWARARALLEAHPGLPRASIYTAAAACDVSAVRAYLDEHPELANAPGGPHGWEPLLYVAFSRLDHGTTGHAAVEVVRLLLAHGADPNAGYLWAGFPCPYTVLTGLFGEGENGPARCPPHPNCYALAEILLEAGADPNDAQTLYNRMFSRDDEHLRFLFAHGLGKDRDNRPWHRMLGEQSGGWVGSPAEMLAYQLQWAARWDYPERVRLLVEHGADVNRPGHRPGSRPPYREAVYHGNEAIARFLAEHGAETFPLDGLDRFACACVSGDGDRARALLAHVPSLIEGLGERGGALMENAAGSDNRDAVRLMAGLGFNVNACGMHEAARYGHLDMIKLLAGLGADVSRQDPGHGIDALGYASHYQQDHVVEYLARFAGIHRAVRSDLLDRVRVLLEEDPGRVYERDEEGNTPLHCLDLDNRMVDTGEILRLLAGHGADVNARNHAGVTPLGRLERLTGLSRRDDLADLLREHGAADAG